MNAQSETNYKLWSLGLIMVPGVVAVVMLAKILEKMVENFPALVRAMQDYIGAKLQPVFDAMGIDMSPQGEFFAYLAKFNSIAPVDECMQYMMIYLPCVMLCIGIKWVRNILPILS